jgi:hypothetical protein
MSVYIIAQLKFTERARYDRYQSRFFGVFKNFRGKLLVADEHPVVLEGEWPRDKVVIISGVAGLSGDRGGPEGGRRCRGADGKGVEVAAARMCTHKLI